MIPKVPRQAIVEAMERFDRELRGTKDWAGWEDRLSYKHAVVHEGRKYPPKEVIALATGASKTQFSGGPVANSYLRSRKFKIEPLRGEAEVIPEQARGVSKLLTEVLERYLKARENDPFRNIHPLCLTFDNIVQKLSAVPAIAARSTMGVSRSMGTGKWSHIPWIALMDERETKTTQTGVHCVFLLREDMSGFYLTLNQGVAYPRKEFGATKARDMLRDRAARIRIECEYLSNSGFLLDDAIDLKASGYRGIDYQAATIAYKFYSAVKPPTDDTLFSDISAILDAYELYLEGTPIAPVKKSGRRTSCGH